MKKFEIGLCLALLGTGSSLAAEMPVKAPPIVLAAHDWTGFYVGGHLGYGVAPDRFKTRQTLLNTTLQVTSRTGDDFRLAPGGWLAGGQVGYNWQFAPAWVAGIEADWAWSNQRDDACVFGCNSGSAHSVTQRLDWLATLRGRFGYAHDGWLWYATAGGAWGRVRETDTITSVGTSNASFDRTQGGWTAGAGVEVAITGNWTGKFEYLYVDLGRTGSTHTWTELGFARTFTVAGEFHDHIVRAGLNYNLSGSSRTARSSRAIVADLRSWAGLYVGGNVGYGVARNRVSSHLGTFLTRHETHTVSPAGILGGGQIGYNWHIARHWVAGVEADAQWSAQKDSSCTQRCNFIPQTNASGAAVGVEQRLRYLATARLRAGYATGDWLAYVTGGAAWAGLQHNDVSNLNSTVSIAEFTHAKSGWAVGTGVETAVAGPWTVKLEYLYVDLGTATESYAIAQGFRTAIRTDLRDHIVRLGLNYNFSERPVVARY